MKIETGIPFPEFITGSPQSGTRKYPFRDMAVGDSFAVDTDTDRGRAMCAGMSYATTTHGKGKRFSSRRQPDGRYRVWRLA